MPDAPMLDLARWHRPANLSEHALLAAVAGPVLDVGCGPGRLVAALRARGIAALGIDAAPAAIKRAASRGVDVLTTSVFDPIPSEGAWATVLLLDGNIGIGGDPERLLRRVNALLDPDGTTIVELASPDRPSGPAIVRLEIATGMVGWFPWYSLSITDINPLAARTGFTVDSHDHRSGRWFARLRRLVPADVGPSA
jgi:SAM-dependent methyltransferase